MGDTGDGRNMTAREVYAEGERRATRDRSVTLATQAKLHAAQILEASREGNDAAVCNLACSLLAQYATALEQALGGTVTPPWFSRRQVAGDHEAAPSRIESGSGLPSLYYRLIKLAEAHGDDVALCLTASVAAVHLVRGELHEALTVLLDSPDLRFDEITGKLRALVLDGVAVRA